MSRVTSVSPTLTEHCEAWYPRYDPSQSTTSGLSSHDRGYDPLADFYVNSQPTFNARQSYIRKAINDVDAALAGPSHETGSESHTKKRSKRRDGHRAAKKHSH